MERAVAPANIFRFGLFEADSARNTLTRNGVRVKLQDQPFRVLLLLLERPGDIVSRDELRQRLWSEGTYVDFDGSLNVILKKLRAALDDDSENPRFIETIPRRGYRFIAPVTVEPKAPATSLDSAAVVTAVEIAPESVPLVEPAPALQVGESAVVSSEVILTRTRPGYFVYAISAAVVLLIGVGWAVWHNYHSNSTRAGAHVPMRKSIAVLGFHNISGHPDDGWLSTAFSEMLRTELSGGEHLRLVSGEDVANLRVSSPWSQTDTLDQETTARIGNALSSDLLVLGSYTTIGKSDRGQLRLDVRLQDARTGEILTEIAEIGAAQDLFQIVSRVGTKLRERLGIPGMDEIEQASVVASLPRDPEAARLYALGLARLRQFDASSAKDLLEQATAADPKFPLSHVQLSRAWGVLGYEQNRRDEAKRAFDLSTDLPRAERMLVEGDYNDSLGNHEKAASIYHALFALFPDNVEYGLQLASAQQIAGHGSEALATIAQLRNLPAPASQDPNIDLVAARTVRQKADSLNLIHAALAKASAQGKKLVYARARHDECITLVYGEHPQDGEIPCEEAYSTFLAAGNRLAAADCLRLIGDRQGGQGHYDQAIDTYQKSLSMLQSLGDHEKMGAVLNNMANAMMNQGKLDKAEPVFRQAKMHFDAAGDRRNSVTAMSNLADVLYLRGQLAAATTAYHQALETEQSFDPSQPGYLLYRLADLELTQGNIKDAHLHVTQAIDSFHGELAEPITSALMVLGEVAKAEGDLNAAKDALNRSLSLRQKLGDMTLVSEAQEELADLAIEEGHAADAENTLRQAIAVFEKENSAPDQTTAYTLLSNALLTQGKTEEARAALVRAADFDRSTPDPSLKLPISIQRGRIEASATNPASDSHQELRASAATAKKLGYYNLECEARLVLGELDMKSNPASGRSQLTALAAETRSHGLELLARHAEQSAAATGTVVAANKP